MTLNWNSNSQPGIIADSHPRQWVQPLPYGVYFGTVIVFCLAGFSLAIYLAISHYRIHTDIGYQSFCALSKAINCDTVSQSPYSVFGGLSVAVWGAAGYGFFLGLLGFIAMTDGEHHRGWTLCLVTAFVFSLVSVLFAGISSFLIKSYCLICIATYAINFLLLYFAWIIRRRFQAGRLLPELVQDLFFVWVKRRFSIPFFAIFTAATLSTLLLFPTYWRVTLPKASLSVRNGLTEGGHFWMGAEEPELDIVEFTDYQCFQCRKMHYYLRELVARHSDKIRLTHRNYPMDHEFNPIVTESFHVGSGKMALLAIHAALKGKFLEVNDLLFEKAASGHTIVLSDIAQASGIDQRELQEALRHEPYRRHLLLDIRYGMKLRIRGTPSYLINGKVYEGRIPSEILTSLTEEAER